MCVSTTDKANWVTQLLGKCRSQIFTCRQKYRKIEILDDARILCNICVKIGKAL